MAYDPEQARQAATEVLQRHWKHPDFRAGQWEVIEAVLQGRDVLAVLPTGGGKSILYQVPAVLRGGLTLVVSPLIALMQDQVAGLRARGVPATFINSTLSAREVEQRWIDAEFGRYRLLYVAPERLQTDLFLARAERLKVTLLAVDEAHCISEWGPHFRPSYLAIGEARRALGEPPAMAVTATATPRVRRDIVEHLGLRSPFELVKGFDRPGIVWSIFREENKRAKVLDVLRSVPGPGIVYAATRRATERWAEWLVREGEAALAYHGGMAAPDRAAVQQAWLQDEVRLIVATNAFGMGIDKPDVRAVIHVDLPATLEAYYQEAGRAGRDGKKAYAVLLYAPEDEATQRTLLAEGHPSVKTVQAVYDAVCNLAQIPLGSQPEAPVPVQYEAVAKVAGCSVGAARAALELLVRQETWTLLPARRNQGFIRFLQPADAVRRYADGLQNRALGTFVAGLLRIVHADAFLGWWEIDLRLLETRLKLSRDRLHRGLLFLQERGLLAWRAPEEALQVVFNAPRTRRIPVDDLAVHRALRRAQAQLEDMIRYARSVTCRRHFLLTYFGEASPPRCGRCDLCLGRHRAVVVTPEDEPVMRHILRQVEAAQPRARWFEADAALAQRAEGLLDWLVQEGYLHVQAPLDETYALTPKAYDLMAQWKPRSASS